MNVEVNIETPKDEILALLLKKYGPVTVQQKELNVAAYDQSIRITITGDDLDDPEAEVTIELVEA